LCQRQHSTSSENADENVDAVAPELGIPKRYAQRMTIQIAVKLPDSVVLEIDALVDDGRFASRSDAVRRGLSLMIERSRADLVDRSFVEGFTRQPERAEELDDARRLAIEAIHDEPWKKWW